MLLRCLRPALALRAQARGLSSFCWLQLLFVVSWLALTSGMTNDEVRELRKETRQIFYHGFDNYMRYAFPEDELKPVSCRPLTRDRLHPSHFELNDVLGNYSLTLIDNLSTLAILASSPESGPGSRKALKDFQKGVVALVQQYGDGTDGPTGRGIRARGFDLDSKVQVFETVIRGLGGLLSAHLFAVGDLPIRGYEPHREQVEQAKAWGPKNRNEGIKWPHGFRYNGQLLRLAYDLGQRLLPAFSTATGIPYPRVNLHSGVPFYPNSPLNDGVDGQCLPDDETPEITETCSAGSGSLLLEFITLSRLTGDYQFETLAKRAFWAIWERRSVLNLIGSGIDAENGVWQGPYTGIGAGIDSFFEYAFKTYVLLSGVDRGDHNPSIKWAGISENVDSVLFRLNAEQSSPLSFLKVWNVSHAAIKRHINSVIPHSHYIQGDLFTGALRASWFDSLSAYYPGLLTLAGELDEAIEAHLLTAALWTRYSGIPERWSAATRDVEGGLGWWGGRPEFIESTYYLFRATQDPWYLHVGEMVLRDIKRRCWARCGWSGLQDVRTGDLNDRMESFFLGETAQYLFLLFDSEHPLNSLDKPFVFSTEGHPLLIPRDPNFRTRRSWSSKTDRIGSDDEVDLQAVCSVPPESVPLSVSATAARPDLFHASALVGLHHILPRAHPGSPLLDSTGTTSDMGSPSNSTYYPWTLPPQYIPAHGMSSIIPPKATLELTFPTFPNVIFGSSTMQRVQQGIRINSIGGLRFGMIRDVPMDVVDTESEDDQYRIHVINNINLGKDEKIFLSKDVMSEVNALDPNFQRIRDNAILDIVIDTVSEYHQEPTAVEEGKSNITTAPRSVPGMLEQSDSVAAMRIAINSILQQVSSIFREPELAPKGQISRLYIPAVSSTGLGAAPLPDFPDAPSADPSGAVTGSLLWHNIYFGDETCDEKLPLSAPRDHEVIVIRRGYCSFSQKLQNIPSFAPSRMSLQLVIVVTDTVEDSKRGSRATADVFERQSAPSEEWRLVRPHLQEIQHTPAGLPRHNAIPMVLVGGGDETYELLKRAVGVGVKRRYYYQSQGVPIRNLIIT